MEEEIKDDEVTATPEVDVVDSEVTTSEDPE